MTTFKHAALVCTSQEKADRFYGKLLGLEKAAAKILPRSLAQAIFQVDRDVAIINYTGNGIHFEIFIDEAGEACQGAMAHTCIEVEQRTVFLDACRELDIPVNKVEKGDKILLFVRDPDGNLFEIKSRR